MSARWTDEGRQQGGVPRDGSGNRIPREKLTWKDSNNRKIPFYDEKGTTNLTYNHEQSVVEHWNELGNNQSRAERNDFYIKPDNLTPMSRSRNSTEGVRLGVNYQQETGSNYSP